jgi:hypothetical protein
MATLDVAGLLVSKLWWLPRYQGGDDWADVDVPPDVRGARHAAPSCRAGHLVPRALRASDDSRHHGI